MRRWGTDHHILARLALRTIQTSSQLGGAQDLDSFAGGCSASYIEGLYNKWKLNPRSVDEVRKRSMVSGFMNESLLILFYSLCFMNGCKASCIY